jgi:hypothetical protein
VLVCNKSYACFPSLSQHSLNQSFTDKKQNTISLCKYY